jgi:hypothetical protein
VDGQKITDWRKAIGELILLHQHIRDLDHEGIWSHELPRVAATPEDIALVERQLQRELPSRFGDFLACADGWRAFYQWVDLFGTKDLIGEPARLAARRMDELDHSGVLARAGLKRADLLPVAMTRPGRGADVPDVFVLARSPHGGEVVWLADDEIDRFPNFDAFYLSMLDYTRKEIETLASEAKQQGRVV